MTKQERATMTREANHRRRIERMLRRDQQPRPWTDAECMSEAQDQKAENDYWRELETGKRA